jgi:hypothetical protein
MTVDQSAKGLSETVGNEQHCQDGWGSSRPSFLFKRILDLEEAANSHREQPMPRILQAGFFPALPLNL